MNNIDVADTKFEIKDTNKYGLGLFAARDIRKDEVIVDYFGAAIFEAEKCSDLPKNKADYAVQIDEHKWVDVEGFKQYLNHSCEPNCGIKGKFQVVAMRDIKRGEQLTFDYEMTEDSDWQMECLCGSPSCRKVIGAYKNMPLSIQKKYNGYISQWLREKYGNHNEAPYNT